MTNLGSNLSTIVPQLGKIVGGSIVGNIAEFVVQRVEGTQTIVTKVYLKQGSNGQWKITDM